MRPAEREAEEQDVAAESFRGDDGRLAVQAVGEPDPLPCGVDQQPLLRAEASELAFLRSGLFAGAP